MQIVSFFVAFVVFVFAALLIVLDEIHYNQILHDILPESLAQKITPQSNFILLVGSLIVMGLVYVEHRYHERRNPRAGKSEEATPTGDVSNTATAIGNKLEHHVHNYASAPPDDIAEAVVRRLEREKLTGSVAAVEAPISSEARIVPGDGFVQLEKCDLQVPSKDLAEGQMLEFKYFYANRGGLPVHDVQSWGVTAILDPLKNPGQRLRDIMKAAARDGYKKFPSAGITLGVNIEQFAFAPLASPLTGEQMEAMQQGREAIHFMVGGLWRDNSNVEHYWAACRMFELPSFPSLENLRSKNL